MSDINTRLDIKIRIMAGNEFGFYQGGSFRIPYQSMQANQEKKIAMLDDLSKDNEKQISGELEQFDADLTKLLPNHADYLREEIDTKKKEFYGLMKDYGNDMHRLKADPEGLSRLNKIRLDLKNHPVMVAGLRAKEQYSSQWLPALMDPSKAALLPASMKDTANQVVYGIPDQDGKRLFNFPSMGTKSNYDLVSELNKAGLISYETNEVQSSSGHLVKTKTPQTDVSKEALWNFVSSSPEAKHIFDTEVMPKIVSNVGFNPVDLALNPEQQNQFKEKYGLELLEFLAPSMYNSSINKKTGQSEISNQQAYRKLEDAGIDVGSAYASLLNKRSKDFLYNSVDKESEKVDKHDPRFMLATHKANLAHRNSMMMKEMDPPTWSQHVMQLQENERIGGTKVLLGDKSTFSVKTVPKDGLTGKTINYMWGKAIFPKEITGQFVDNLRISGSNGNTIASNNKAGKIYASEELAGKDNTFVPRAQGFTPWSMGADPNGATTFVLSQEAYQNFTGNPDLTDGIYLHAPKSNSNWGPDASTTLEKLFPDFGDKGKASREASGNKVTISGEQMHLTSKDVENLNSVFVHSFVTDENGKRDHQTVALGDYLEKMGVVRNQPTVRASVYSATDTKAISPEIDRVLYDDDLDFEQKSERLAKLTANTKVKDEVFILLDPSNPNYSTTLDANQSKSDQKTQSNSIGNPVDWMMIQQ